MTSASVLPLANAAQSWYAVRVRRNFEQITVSVLESKGYESYLPLIHARRRWSDRVKNVQVPLFAGYVFARFDAKHRVPILDCAGVVDIVSFGNRCVPIPDEELISIRAMLESSQPAEAYPFLPSGQKIRIERGPLAGVEGIVVEVKSHYRLIASVTLLQRSVSVEIDRDWALPLSSGPLRPTILPTR